MSMPGTRLMAAEGLQEPDAASFFGRMVSGLEGRRVYFAEAPRPQLTPEEIRSLRWQERFSEFAAEALKAIPETAEERRIRERDERELAVANWAIRRWRKVKC